MADQENEKAQNVSRRQGNPARSSARLHAVQAAYQAIANDQNWHETADEFLTHRIGQKEEGELHNPDRKLFRDIVKGTGDNLAAIDVKIEQSLEGRTLPRVEPLILAILRAAGYELIFRTDVPVRVVLNEYMDVANAFFTGDEPRFVNGVLNRVAHDVRGNELS